MKQIILKSGRKINVLPQSEINNFVGYDFSVAEMHVNNCGFILTDAQFNDVLDNEFDLAECYEILKKNKPVFEHKLNDFGTDYIQDIKLLLLGMQNDLNAMDDEGNKYSIPAIKYLHRELERKFTELTHIFPLVKKYINA